MTRQSIAQQAHEAMHQHPGVPEHSEAATRNQRPGLANRPLKNRSLQSRGADRNTQNHGRPKVLVGWQNAIARFFGSKAKQS